YTTAYEMYSKAKNLEKCKDVLAKAKKNVNEQFVIYIHLLDLGYNAEIGDTAKMDKALERIYKRDTMADIMSDAANYLLNAGMYDKAEQVLNRGLEKSPKDFSLNNMMAYGYFLRVDNIIKLRNQAITERNYELANQYKEQQDALMNNAHEWAQKAFDIQPDHLQNAKMLKQLKLQLGKEVPAELNAIIEKYTQPKE
ncbi:MAG: tetratricopeptide repeat protein, partial [Bacteroidales bacterium]|nr:tetratricopeptide repeat protein [Bacteroidales bacterium]